MAPCHTLANDKQYHLFAIFVRPRESTAIDQAHQYYRAYASKINRYILLKTNDPELSADLTHESFARLFTLLQQKESVEKPLAYLYTVANHLVIDHLRSHATSRTDSMPPEEMESHLDPLADPELHAMSLSSMQHLHDLLLRLPLRTRQVFQLARIDGLRYKDVAERLDISVSSVQKHLASALEFITQHLQDEP